MNLWTEGILGDEPIDDALRARVLASFVTGVEVALRDVSRTEAVEFTAFQRATRRILGDWGVLIELNSATESALALGFPQSTATALAQRMLADTPANVDEALIRDCAGELANVVAGQAKAFLAETPDRFTFSPPRFVPCNQDLPIGATRTCLVVVFSTDVGSFTLQLFVK